jgi:hypothetical protein
LKQAGIFPGMIAPRLVKPRVEPCASHPQYPAHQCDGMVTTVLVHEAVPSATLADLARHYGIHSKLSALRQSDDHPSVDYFD